MSRHPYYKYDKLYSYNGTYNFLVGGRGLGKTFGAKEKAIRDGIKTQSQFIYLRRYKEELATARNTFFADVLYKFPNYEFQVQGNEAQVAPLSTHGEKKREWKTIGYFIALSTSQKQKSVAFPRVTKIIFDEFIIERGAIHYLPDEAIIFNNFYSTVDRGLDKTIVLFLANSVSIMNPYFLEYDIRPDESSEWLVKNDGFVVCHFPNADEFQASIYQTKFGKFIKGTEYAKYAIGNDFSDNHENLLGSKDSRAKYKFTLECQKGMFSVWHTNVTDEYFIQEKLPKAQIMFTLVAEKMSEEKTLMGFRDKPLAYLRAAFNSGRVNFDKPVTRNTFTEIFKR
jgi:hypothetical protein